MSLTYSQYVSDLQTLLATNAGDANFTEILPSIIDYAEQRIYRELNLLSTVTRNSTQNATANTRDFTLPDSPGRFVTVTGVNVITPVGQSANNGTRNPLTATSRAYIDTVWPTKTAASATTIPTHYAMITDQELIFGPSPGASFTVEVIGTIRPTPLSASNTSTFLSNYLPDLFLAASMVFATGYSKNFGAQASDPKMGQSWEQQYQILFASANAEEMRKKFAAG